MTHALFKKEVQGNIETLGKNAGLKQQSIAWLTDVAPYKYSYNFSWFGRPIIQFPQDMVAMQELIASVKPDLIIETGIAHGGSLIMNASMLALLDYNDAITQEKLLDPQKTQRKVLGIDIDIRQHNKEAIEKHPMSNHIDMIEGSSIDRDIIEQVYEYAKDFSRILISLDSNHTHDHVLKELQAYAPLTSKGSYCVVFDTVIEDMPKGSFPDRPWGKGNNPKTAVWEFMEQLRTTPCKNTQGEDLNFSIDSDIENKLLITVAPDGYLKRI